MSLSQLASIVLAQVQRVGDRLDIDVQDVVHKGSSCGMMGCKMVIVGTM